MLKTILFYFIFILYMLGTVTKKIKLDRIKSIGDKNQIENYIYISVKNWANFILRLVNAKIKLEGKENVPQAPCLFVANHQGFFDIPIIISSLDRMVGFIAKKEITKIGLLTYWMKQINCVFIDRQNIRESIKSINEGIKILKSGHSMVIFPEGTRSKGPKIGEFKKGSLKLALKSRVPIVPIAIDGSYKLREGNNHSILKPAEVKMTICKPIYIDDMSKEELSNLSTIIKQKISEKIYLQN
ncbi:lysophospholipid acyltransferase family protein [Clostridium luticellarii]|uniref:lysophospholipid acyltransferase family protein n=1 Tax=Clostridium luticellarii TaxID=1691940 RepID=UPI00235502F2|nr:lysophospholipid acyltransferase family protein [Clostridium luticellarii]MCI1946079.1 1-acyl-sn-glycerol-3-phosphate acyltransferase [Clostridium luticellarii]MCI1967515.1 1-acyl-sn-glycerol-3-phosphate acyltransferase [Clostridium luticellarii]